MKPIRASYNYIEQVDVNPTNPKHAAYIGMDKAPEKRQLSGFVTEILRLTDNGTNRVQNGIKDGVAQYKDISISQTGVYVVFWIDKGDYFQMSIQSFNDITVLNKEMNNYVNSFYAT